MAVKIAPDARRQFVNASGVPYSGAKLFYYASGSTTKQNTYTTSAGNVANSNPIVLDSAGRTPYGVWLTAGLTYKEVLAPSTDTDPPGSPIYTEDGISGINDTAGTASQWVASALTPTYISGTSFSVAGDQTTELHIGRRLQLSVTAGTVYARISNSVYGALTTVTVVMDSGALDSGLSSFNWSILSATNHAVPKLTTAELTALDIGTLSGTQTVSGNKTFTGATVLQGTVNATATVFAGTVPLVFEGSGADAFETSLSITNPTADRTLTIPDASIDLTIAQAASQAAMEAGTAVDRTVTPLSVGFAPGVAKAWVAFLGAGTVNIYGSYNVSSITDNGVGDYTVNFTVPMGTGNYAMIGNAEDDNANKFCVVSRWSTDARSTTQCRIRVFNELGNAVDTSYIAVTFFGTF